MDFVQLIREGKIEEAYINVRSLIDNKETKLNADKCWTKIYEGNFFEESMVVVDRAVLPEDFHQSIRIYLCLSIIQWDAKKLSEFRKAAKFIIAKISQEYRIWLMEDTRSFHVDPNIRVFLQDLIYHFSSYKLFEDKADMAAVKAQLSGTLLQCGLIKKYEFGNDMLQYADEYASLGLREQALQIYQAIQNDFINTHVNNPFRTTFPEIRYINDPDPKENEVFNKAKNKVEELKLVQ